MKGTYFPESAVPKTRPFNLVGSLYGGNREQDTRPHQINETRLIRDNWLKDRLGSHTSARDRFLKSLPYMSRSQPIFRMLLPDQGGQRILY